MEAGTFIDALQDLAFQSELRPRMVDRDVEVRTPGMGLSRPGAEKEYPVRRQRITQNGDRVIENFAFPEVTDRAHTSPQISSS